MIYVPINTPARGFLFRCARWIAMGTAPLLILGPDAWKYSWLLLSCLAPLAVREITRASIRRKLPVDPMQKLQRRLDRAVKAERYEEAAKLRDEIKLMPPA